MVGEEVYAKMLTGDFGSQTFLFLPRISHFSTLSVSRQVCKVSIDLLTLAGLSANISADGPANPGRCTVSL